MVSGSAITLDFGFSGGAQRGTRLIGADSFPRMSKPRFPSASRALDVALPDRRASRSNFVLSMPHLICGNWIGDHTRSSPFRSGSFQDAKLLKRGHPVVEANFLCDLAVLDAEHGCAREPHLPARCRWQGAHEEVAEGGSGVRAAAFPATHHIVTLGDEVRGAPEVKVGERRTELHHKVPHVVATTARSMERVLKKHIGRCEFVDDFWLPWIAPEPIEPTTHNRLVVLFARHFRPS